MSNKHAFDSIKTTEVHTFDSNINVIKYFNSILSYLRTYNVTIEGFLQTDSWFAKFLQQNNITVEEINMFVNYISDFHQSDSMNVSNSSIGMNINQSVSFKQSDNMISRMFMGFPLGITSFNQLSNMICAMVDRLILTGVIFSVSGNVIDANITVASYYLVSDWDSYLLSDLDAMNLSDMEYQIT